MASSVCGLFEGQKSTSPTIDAKRGLERTDWIRTLVFTLFAERFACALFGFAVFSPKGHHVSEKKIPNVPGTNLLVIYNQQTGALFHFPVVQKGHRPEKSIIRLPGADVLFTRCRRFLHFWENQREREVWQYEHESRPGK